MTDLTDFVALSLLPSSCWRHAATFLRAGESPRAVFDRMAGALGLRGSDSEPAALRRKATAAIERAAQAQLTPVTWGEAEYPAALTTIVDPPFVLWTRGLVDTLSRPAVAIVGSRAASEYGLAVATRLASDLAGRGVVIVSGLARGIDAAAHRGALSACDGPSFSADGSTTIAVLGSGVDVMYPPEHKGLARQIERRGIVVSELAAGTPPLKPFFPLRNRLISGLARAVVIVEAGEKSGSLITARLALEQGRDVLAVPGNVLNGRNRGAHALLRDGAKIVESADDILDELALPGSIVRGHDPRVDDPILTCLTPGEPSDLDAIAERTGVAAPRLLPRLLELELAGLVARVGGGRFVRS